MEIGTGGKSWVTGTPPLEEDCGALVFSLFASWPLPIEQLVSTQTLHHNRCRTTDPKASEPTWKLCPSVNTAGQSKTCFIFTSIGSSSWALVTDNQHWDQMKEVEGKRG